MVNLTTLAPEIGAAILDDTMPDNITLLELAADPPVLWGAFILEIQCSITYNDHEVSHRLAATNALNPTVRGRLLNKKENRTNMFLGI